LEVLFLVQIRPVRIVVRAPFCFVLSERHETYTYLASGFKAVANINHIPYYTKNKLTSLHFLKLPLIFVRFLLQYVNQSLKLIHVYLLSFDVFKLIFLTPPQHLHEEMRVILHKLSTLNTVLFEQKFNEFNTYKIK
jgi:hypothetical protein